MVRNTKCGKIAFYQAWTDDNLLIFEYCGRVQAFRVIPDVKYIIAIEGGTIRLVYHWHTKMFFCLSWHRKLIACDLVAQISIYAY